MIFTLPTLPYSYDALEPHIDTETMKIHHSKHHQTYINNANTILNDIPETGIKAESNNDVVKVIKFGLDKKNTALFNNAAQHFNHIFFWQCMKPNGGGEPNGKLLDLINKNFGSFTNMMEEFKKISMSQFGSGWGWLVYNMQNQKLEIIKTPNGETPVINNNLQPILGLDVWEHAYYLKYQNKRADYIDAFFKVIDWEFAQKNLENALSKK